MTGVCLIKLSSLGDVIHTLPALSDLQQHAPHTPITWVVEPAFEAIIRWHRHPCHTIPVALRRWRKSPGSHNTWRQALEALQALRATEYEHIIDLQGLIKSAALGRMARSPSRHGYDAATAPETPASWFYHHPHCVPKDCHAVTRTRRLLSTALGHTIDENVIDFGLPPYQPNSENPTVVLLHGTTWPTKTWPLSHWRACSQRCQALGLNVEIPWGTPDEHAFAKAIKEGSPQAQLWPKMNLTEVMERLRTVTAVVGLDTGLTHLSAALGVPTVGLYGATHPHLAGPMGPRTAFLAANQPPCAPCHKRRCAHSPDASHPPCLAALDPRAVMDTLASLLP